MAVGRRDFLRSAVERPLNLYPREGGKMRLRTEPGLEIRSDLIAKTNLLRTTTFMVALRRALDLTLLFRAACDAVLGQFNLTSAAPVLLDGFEIVGADLNSAKPTMNQSLFRIWRQQEDLSNPALLPQLMCFSRITQRHPAANR